jgi:hypothetical protein
MTCRTKYLSVWIALVSPILTYSSVESALIPYASCWIADVIFWYGDNPKWPQRQSWRHIKLDFDGEKEEQREMNYSFQDPELVICLEILN